MDSPLPTPEAARIDGLDDALIPAPVFPSGNESRETRQRHMRSVAKRYGRAEWLGRMQVAGRFGSDMKPPGSEE